MNNNHNNHIDFPLLIAVLALMLMSLGIVYSASATWAQVKYEDSETILMKHAGKVFLGITALFVGMKIDYTKLQRLTKIVLIISVVLLILTLFFGEEIRGSKRWLNLGIWRLQTSELAKFALLFHLSTLIAVKKARVKDFKTGFMPMLLWVVIVTGLVLPQPDFSTGTMIFGLGLLMLFIGSARMNHILGVLFVGVVVLGLYMISEDYRLARITSFLGSGETPANSGDYQLRQGILGFASGGIFGVGPGESKQRDLFLPEPYGDFVFSIVGEEYGFIGTTAIMACFLLIMLRGIRIACYAEDEFGRCTAAAITSTITAYAVVNAGVTLGLLPTTGLPMPFISYGGTSMVLSAFGVGVLLNISSQTILYPRLQQLQNENEQKNELSVIGKVY